MCTIMVSLRAGDLAEVMITMRRWLDEYQIEPLLFRYNKTSHGKLLMTLDFAAGNEAEAFAAAFQAHQTDGMAQGRGGARPS